MDLGAAADIAREADKWRRINAPPPAPGQSWTVTVTVASAVDDTSQRPLLSLTRMVCGIKS